MASDWSGGQSTTNWLVKLTSESIQRMNDETVPTIRRVLAPLMPLVTCAKNVIACTPKTKFRLNAEGMI
jgi:hypothetical protein